VPRLGCEDVVRATGGLHVHHLEAHARLDEGAGDLGVREAQMRAGAEQDDLGPELDEGCEVLGRETIEARGAPVVHDAIGQHDQVALEAPTVDRHVAGAVAGEGVRRAGRGKMQLQRKNANCGKELE
jgi:hypothetical protein